ncbi:MAG: hypothetical protein ACHQVK_03175, partial [Candidatus Paceibacterales bacterium]
MAKQKPGKAQPAQTVKRPSTQKSGSSGFSYFGRNMAVAAVLLVIAFMFNKKFDNQRRYNELTETFYRLRAQNQQSPELRPVYDEIMQLQPDVVADTGFFTRILRGYNWAINELAISNLDN